ncbi:MAG TPA: hypothetical protein VKB31_09280 [Trueperaceae bacterium]|nr:hypothetical protein [Trueperaceae bacterium]
MGFEERTQAGELPWRVEHERQSGTAVGIDGGHWPFGEGILEAERELYGAAAYAHARQVDLEALRRHGVRATIHSTFATHASTLSCFGPGGVQMHRSHRLSRRRADALSRGRLTGPATAAENGAQ